MHLTVIPTCSCNSVMGCSLMDLIGPQFQLRGHLQVVETRILTVPHQKLFVSTLLDDPSSFEDDNAVGKSHCGKTMGNNNRGPRGRCTAERFHNDLFCRGVQVAGRLVKDQNG